MTHETVEQGVVQVGAEAVLYEIRVVDARSAPQREQDAHLGRPAGNIVVIVPGHGQSIYGPKKLATAAAEMSKSKIVWCVDPVPARGGDRIEAQAIASVVRDRISADFPAAEVPTVATLIGWSHGGGEALRAAEQNPDLFPRFLGLCSTGLVERRKRELLVSFFLEASRILWESVRQREWTCLRDTLRLGWNAAAGMARDLWRGRSLRRVYEDIEWATSKVTHGANAYHGEVVLLFGAHDTVVRWHDAFPACATEPEIDSALTDFQGENFPRASRVQVRVIEGAHVAPEVDPPAFLRVGLDLLGQLDAPALEQRRA